MVALELVSNAFIRHWMFTYTLDKELILDIKYRFYYINSTMTMDDVIKLFKYPGLYVYYTDYDKDFSSHIGNFGSVYLNFQDRPHTLSIIYPTQILISPIDFRIGIEGEIESFPVENNCIKYSEITLDKLKEIIYNCYSESVLNAKNFLVKLKKEEIDKDFT